MKQIQSLIDQMSLMIRSQQPSLPPPVESGRHMSELWCVQCGQLGHTKQFCRTRQNRNERSIGNPPPPNHGGHNFHVWSLNLTKNHFIVNYISRKFQWIPHLLHLGKH